MHNNAIFYEGIKPVKLKKWYIGDNSQTILLQAKRYADMVKQSGVKTLRFYPLKKTAAAIPNQFRLAVYNFILETNNERSQREYVDHGDMCMTDPEYVPKGYLVATWLYELTDRLVRKGYDIVETMPE